MLGTEFLKGQGLGNQLFCYVTARCLAIDLGYEFGCAGKSVFANNIHNCKGMYFLEVDLGGDPDVETYGKYYEREHRIIVPNSRHDVLSGCYVAGVDDQMFRLSDDTLIYGNMQDERYFFHHMEDIKEWLKVRPEYESNRFSDDNICVLNFRGGEYVGGDELFLSKSYWEKAMAYMKKINDKMQFLIITDDIKSANKMLPDIPAYHFDLAGDYVAIKNAKYLIVSNSSFACFPVFTSNTLKFLIAPKYWARHNVSDGYWASEQNIYTGWNYMDRKGHIFSAEECRRELEKYKRKSRYFNNQNGIRYSMRVIFYKIYVNFKYYFIIVKRKLGLYFNWAK